MESKGRLISAQKDFCTQKLQLTFEVDAASDDSVNELVDSELTIKAVKYRKKRSLSANAYFHVILGQMAEALTISKAEMKNRLITSYGQYEVINNKVVYIKANVEPEDMAKREDLHCKPCRYDKDGTVYHVYRGTHTYNSSEMSKLIDGMVAEAKELGIETLPTEELKRMVEAWNVKEK